MLRAGNTRRFVRLSAGVPPWVLTGSVLDMNFAAGLYYGADIANGISVTRATPTLAYAAMASGLLVGFAPNILRVTDQGALIEEARTNLLLQSQDFATTWSIDVGSISTNTTVAPDGTTTADTFTGAAGTTDHQVYQTITLEAATTTAIAVYVKAGTSNYFSLGILKAVNIYAVAVFDLSNGTVGETKTGSITGTIVSTSITPAGNGFYRIVLVGSIGSVNPTVILQQASAATGNTFDSRGNITSAPGNLTTILWQADAQAGAFITSPILTTTTSATRAADNVTAIGPLLAAMKITIGSMFFAVNMEGETTNQFLMGSAGTSGSFGVYLNSGSSFVPQSTLNGVANLAVGSRAPVIGTNEKISVVIQAGAYKTAIGNGAVGTSANATVPVPGSNPYGIGNNGSAGGYLNGYLSRLAIGNNPTLFSTSP